MGTNNKSTRELEIIIRDLYEDLVWAYGRMAAAIVEAAVTVERLLRTHVIEGNVEATAIYMVLACDALSKEVRGAFDSGFAREMVDKNGASSFYERLLTESEL